MISADVKTYKNNKNQKIWWLYLTNFYKKYFQNLKKYNVKTTCAFHLILVGILSILIQLPVPKSHKSSAKPVSSMTQETPTTDKFH